MGNLQILTASEAIRAIKPGDTIYFSGSGGGHGVPELIIKTLGDEYRKSGTPSGLTIASSVSIGDWRDTGFNYLAQEGLVKQIITGGLNNCPRMSELVESGLEVHTLPQGVLAHLTRERAAGRPGLISKVGLGTFVDPTDLGGAQTTNPSSRYVERINLDGEPYLFYRAFPINVAVIRGTTIDQFGNVSIEEEAFKAELFELAVAAKRSGGIVICQAKYLSAGDSLKARDVVVPAPLVDVAVIDAAQRQVYSTPYDPAYAGWMRVPEDDGSNELTLGVRELIARRAALELRSGDLVNLGYGISNLIAVIARAESIHKKITLTVEQGVIGGVPAGGIDAGAGKNYRMLATHAQQFTMYDGGILDIAFLSFAELDGCGNVNVSKYGRNLTGPGGFINISVGAKRVVFVGTFTTRGLQISTIKSYGIKIQREGQIHKLVKKVQQITFSGAEAARQKKDILYVTERAVFRLIDGRVTLIEIAPGVDIVKDIKSQMDFELVTAPRVEIMNTSLYREALLGLSAQMTERQEAANHE